jgi:hypothetical protein
MTEASTGLRKALARGQKVTAEALAALSNEELIAGLSADQKAAVAAAHAAEAEPSASDDEDEDDTDAPSMGDKKKSKDKEKDYMDDKAIAEAKAEERARFGAVMASEHYQGREKLAATLLANDKMSADEIITALAAAAPAAPAKADDGDDDAAARAAMRDKLAAEQPGPTGQAADEPEPEADNSLVENMKAMHGLK